MPAGAMKVILTILSLPFILAMFVCMFVAALILDLWEFRLHQHRT